MKREILNKPNQLIGLKTTEVITATQRKIYNVFLKTAQQEVKFGILKNKDIDEDKTYWFEIDYDIAHNIAGANNKNLNYIEDEMKRLIKIMVEITDKKNGTWEDAFSLLPRIKKEGKKYKFMLIGNIVKALREQNYFTHLDLMRIQNLSSQYSVILYELAIKYQKVEIPKMSIEKFREITNTENKYSTMKGLRRRVLNPACEEISEKTDIILDYKTEKKGRRIAYIKFKLERKNDESISNIEEKKVKNKEQIYSQQVLELFQLLPSLEQVEANKRELAKLLKEHSLKYLKADIDYTKKAQPDNFMGFLKASCQSGHYSNAELEKEKHKEELLRQRKEEERRKQKLEKKIKQKAKEKAYENYEKLSAKTLEQYGQKYEALPKMLKDKITKKEFIIGALEEETEQEFRELLM
ncbi:hypothetical protein U472_00525 [Orenia metallireducens]|uniref:Initiator Rep protein WH1 domain-containing protein n=1 Tax=Orenia metallireducens TaxID=1413210 RepID=A0A1C0AD83_9FIRM|nr:replication initiation protein [Orenia metallireducens]OCL28587.1 hypothetical protein U472_00525 [Orenia metallireducens]